MLADVSEGVHSLLELLYLRDVERAHRLPRAARNTPVVRGASRLWKDVRYRAYATTVELDGRIGHAEDGKWRDMRRGPACRLRTGRVVGGRGQAQSSPSRAFSASSRVPA